MSDLKEPRRLSEREVVPRELEATARVMRRLGPSPEVSRAQAEATWDAVLAQTVARSMRPRWVPALGFAVPAVLVIAVGVAVALQPVAQTQPAAWTVMEGARLIAATAEAPARLVEGKVTGLPRTEVGARAEVLSTPHGSVTWRDARFLLDVTPERTLLVVQEGEVVWRGAAGERTLHAGAELRAPPLVQALPPSSDCPASPLTSRIGCLESLARGEGLAAENALFELAWLELHERAAPDAALTRWESYLARFPEGTLESEARAMRVLTLAESGRLSAARAELQRFHEAVPDSPLLPPLDAAMKLSASTGTSALQTGPEGSR